MNSMIKEYYVPEYKKLGTYNGKLVEMHSEDETMYSIRYGGIVYGYLHQVTNGEGKDYWYSEGVGFVSTRSFRSKTKAVEWFMDKITKIEEGK